MTWVRLDDRFAEHPKVVAAGPLAMAMQIAALGYCNRELTDGFIPRARARTLLDFEIERDGRHYTIAVTSGMAGDDVTAAWVIEGLVEAGMWEEAPGGYRIHDYHDYQPTREEVLELRDKRAEAGRLGGLQRAANKQATEANAKQSARQPASKPASKTEANLNPVPVPVPTPVPVSRDPEPEPLAGAGAPRKAKRAAQVPEDWGPTDDDRAWAEREGFAEFEIAAETPRFVRHHRSKGNAFKDVSLAWRNWMDRSRSFGPARAGPNGAPPGGGMLAHIEARQSARQASHGSARASPAPGSGDSIDAEFREGCGR